MLSSVSLPSPLSYRHLVQTTIDFFSSQPALREKLQSMMSLSNTQVRMLSFYLALTSNSIGRAPTRFGSHWSRASECGNIFIFGSLWHKERWLPSFYARKGSIIGALMPLRTSKEQVGGYGWFLMA